MSAYQAVKDAVGYLAKHDCTRDPATGWWLTGDGKVMETSDPLRAAKELRHFVVTRALEKPADGRAYHIR